MTHQNVIRSSVEANGYSLNVSSRLLKSFMRYCGNNICPDKRTNGQTEGQPSLTMLGDEGITRHS